ISQVGLIGGLRRWIPACRGTRFGFDSVLDIEGTLSSFLIWSADRVLSLGRLCCLIPPRETLGPFLKSSVAVYLTAEFPCISSLVRLPSDAFVRQKAAESLASVPLSAGVRPSIWARRLPDRVARLSFEFDGWLD